MPNLPVVAKTPKKKVAKTTVSFPSMVKQEVAKAIAKKTENKLITENGYPNTAIGTSYTQYIFPRVDTSLTRPLLPKLTGGVDPEQRIGATVTPKVLKIRGTIYYDYKYADSRNLSVRMMLVTNRQQKYMPDLLTNAGNQYTSTLMWNGQTGTPTAYAGCQPYYNTLPINRKAWNVIDDKIVHLRKGLNDFSNQTFMSPTTSHDFEYVLGAKDLPATLKYDGGLAITYPTNYAPVMYIGFVDSNGAMAVGDTGSDSVIEIQYTTQLIFEDN